MTIKTTHLFLGLLLYCGLFSSAFAQGAGGGPPATVRVAEARVTELAPTMEVPGTVASRFDARLAAEVSGRLVYVADIGELLEKGQPVARIDDASYQLQIAEFEGRVARAKSRIAFLAREVERLQKLAAQNIAAKSLLDQTESDLAVARQDLKIASAQLGITEVQLSMTQIKAPFSGVVTERFKEFGERVGIGDTVLRLVNQETLDIIARAPLSSVSYVSVEDQLELFNERVRSTGTVRTLVPVGDPRSHMFELRLKVPADRWRIGETVRVVVPTKTRQSVLAVPRDALVLRRDGTTVYRVNQENTAERIAVETGISANGWVAITGDITEGDKVVIRGAERLRAGQTVNVIGGSPTAPPGSDDKSSG